MNERGSVWLNAVARFAIRSASAGRPVCKYRSVSVSSTCEFVGSRLDAASRSSVASLMRPIDWFARPSK